MKHSPEDGVPPAFVSLDNGAIHVHKSVPHEVLQQGRGTAEVAVEGHIVKTTGDHESGVLHVTVSPDKRGSMTGYSRAYHDRFDAIFGKKDSMN